MADHHDAAMALVALYRTRKTALKDGNDSTSKKAHAHMQALSLAQIKQLVRERMDAHALAPSQHGQVAIVDLLHACFWAFSVTRDAARRKDRDELVLCAMQALHNLSVTSSVATGIVGVLVPEVPRLAVTTLPLAVEEILRGVTKCAQLQRTSGSGAFANFQSLELLPPLLHRVVLCPSISLQDRVADTYGMYECTGSEYSTRALLRLVQLQWPTQLALPMIKIFRELALDARVQRALCVKVMAEFKEEVLDPAKATRASVGMLPTVVYNLLLLLMRMQVAVCRRVLVRLVLLMFRRVTIGQQNESALPGVSTRELRSIQSTLLYHYDLVLKQEEGIGPLFLAELESTGSISELMDLAVVLATGAQPKLAGKVQQLLTQTVIDSYRSDHDKAHPSSNVKGVLRRQLIDLPKECRDGSWTPLVRTLLGVALVLMESKRGIKTTSSTATLTGMSPLADLGTRVVLSCFRYHDAVRESVISHIVHVIITQESTSRMHLQLLKKLSSQHPSDLTPNMQSKLQECLEYVSYLPPATASKVFEALGPWLNASISLKNSLILTLRKAMFRKDSNSRSVAVLGLGFLLCHSSKIFNRQSALSQLYSQNVSTLSQAVYDPSQDVGTQMHASSLMAEDLFRQFCGVFKKALQLQTPVRVVLYQSLVQVVKECPVLRPSIHELVYDHFMRFYEANEGVCPPLKFDKCLERVGTNCAEPLPHLIQALIFCAAKDEMDGIEMNTETEMEDEVPATQAARARKCLQDSRSTLKTLMERMMRCSLQDLDLDLTSSFDDETALGASNRRLATMVLETIEVSMNHVVSHVQDIEESHWNALLEFSRTHHQLSTLLSKGSGTSTASGKRKRGVDTKTPGNDTSTGSEQALKKGKGTRGLSKVVITTTPAGSQKVREYLSSQFLLRAIDYASNQLGSSTSNWSRDDLNFVILLVRESSLLLRAESARNSEPVLMSKDDVCSLGISLLRLLSSCSNQSSQSTGAVNQRRVMDELRQKIANDSATGFETCLKITVRSSAEVFVGFLGKCRRLLVPNATENGNEAHCFVPAMKQLFGSMLAGSQYDVCLCILGAIDSLGAYLSSDEWKELGRWLESVLTTESINSSKLISRILELCVKPSHLASFSPAQAVRLATGLLSLCTDGELEDVGVSVEDPFMLEHMDLKGVTAAASLLIGMVEDSMSLLEKGTREYVALIRKTKLKMSDEDMSMIEQVDRDFDIDLLGNTVTQSMSATYKALCKQVFDCAGVMLPFLMMDLTKSAVTTRVLRSAERLYKVLVSLVQARVRSKDATLPKFLHRLFDRTAGKLSASLLQFISCINEESKRAVLHSASKSKARGESQAAKTQSKLIPDLIYQMEQFDVALIRLSKLCKGVNFSPWCQLRQSRDFRLNKDRIREHIGAEHPHPTNDHEGDESETETAQEPQQNDEAGGSEETECDDDRTATDGADDD